MLFTKFNSIIRRLVTAALILCFSTAAGENMSFLSGYNIGYLTMNEGLLHNHIDDIYRDNRGFLWIGMHGGGLSRYDGNEFINFNLTSSRFQLWDNFVVEMTQDRLNRLWVGTEGGMRAINVYTLHCEEIKDNTGRFSKVIDKPIFGLDIDKNGYLWVRNPQSVACLAFDEDGNVKSLASLSLHDIASESRAIPDIMNDGHPWMSIDGEIKSLTVNFEQDTIMTESVDECLCFDSDALVGDMVMLGGEVWMATNLGLVRYNPAEKKAKTYQAIPADVHSLSHNTVTSLGVTADKRLIAGTLRGLNIYNPISDNFEQIIADDEDNSRTINNNFVNKILVDGRRVWIGSEGLGITRLSPKRLLSYEIRHNMGDREYTQSVPVNAILPESDGSVWIGNVEGGLHHADAGLKKISHYSVYTGHLQHNSVSALARDGLGRLWVGSWGGGISVIRTPEGDNATTERFLLETDNGANRATFVGAMCWDPVNSLMWVGASRGIFVYDESDKSFREAYPATDIDMYGAIGAAVDKDDHMWIGSSNGLFDIDLRKYKKTHSRDAVRHITCLHNVNEKGLNEHITYVFIDHDGRLWIGTNGSGLFRREVKDGKEQFIQLSSVDGLPNDIVCGITQDSLGAIWVSTNSGLVSLLPGGRITSYAEGRDLDNDSFYWNAAGTLADGSVLFGSTSGLLVVDGVVTNQEPISQNINFTHIYVDNKEISVLPGENLRLHESARSIGIEFSAMDLDGNSNGVFSYRLKGFDSDWITISPRRPYCRYTNVPSGHFTLEVRYTEDGNSEPLMEAALPVIVTPYFYKTWWFILLAVFVIGGSITLLYNIRVRNLNERRVELERIVAERTNEIEKQKMHVQQLTMDRISFFTNITHEFRTPITLILGPVERALKVSYNPQVIEQLHFVERNAKYLLSLVNQLMDFRKVESGKMEVMRTRGNLRRFLNELAEVFRPMMKERDIEISFVDRLTRPLLSFDEENLRKVLINLLGNAMKFTSEGGQITLYSTLLPPEMCGGRTHIYIGVADNGTGINPEDIEHIFDRFYQGTSKMSYPVSGSCGSGIGLYLCKSLIDINNGHISVVNNHNGRGCTFRVILPLPDGETPEPDIENAIPELSKQISVTEKFAESSAMNRYTVLIVEDNDDMRAFIRTILSDRFNVMEARNGEEALKALAACDTDLIISDLMMPVMDGLQLSKKVKESFEYSHIPFLMLTAKTGREPRLESYRTGVDEFILKPFDEEMLLARIDNILSARRRYQERFAGRMEVSSLGIVEESRDKKFMDQVMKVIAENYGNSYFEIGDFAETLGVSRSLLNKKLQSLAGQSAGQLLRTYRLNTARDMIMRNRRTRTLNISEIAYQVGFNDSKYFTRCFTKQFNISPSAMMSEN